MLLWINGPFGVGKTTVGRLIGERSPDWRPFDPELVGSMLRESLPGRSFGGDFQHLPAWRRLVPIVAREVSDFAGQGLATIQSVLIEEYWTELRSGLADQGFDVLHVLLDADLSTLRSRIEADTAETGTQALQWRLTHQEVFESNRCWLIRAADLVVDTSDCAPEEVADAILAAAT